MNTSSLIKTIKLELKNQGMTYRDLADYLKMSEAGIKKLLSKDDVSLSKLSQIAKFLNVTVVDLLKKAESDDVDVFEFSPKDIQFFLKSPHYLHFFMKLAYEQRSPKSLQEEFNLTEKSLMLYLKKLESIGLIKRHPHDRTQIMGGIPLAIKTTGTELEVIKYDIAQGILEKLKKRLDPNLHGAGLYLTEEESQDFKAKILSTILDFSEKSRSNRKSDKRNVKDKEFFREYTFMSYLHQASMFDYIINL